MTLPNWRQILIGVLHRNRKQPYSRYFQLATVRTDGYPANRTVVFRGFLNNTNQLKIIVDSRSEKINQIQHQPFAEACWYFTETREQFRLAGKLTLVGADCDDAELEKARVSTWQELSDNARIQFAWAHPGEKRANPEAFAPSQPDAVTPLANFCLLLLDPVKVDHLELRGEPQNRYLYTRDEQENWTCIEINP
ncbi:pyridoxamine 5'-phosphate oxidase-related FMN-binding protein [Calothrix sp. NIES-4071]|nr:pyridoxamine 5'-phosphate oxidase-related FMN-binding protein [Calothrix sp. NIES-4071]BAZ59613.1 pyridoxamine 5'-phosphate oxidase-related FMN-binding protein [Calothrix sp. NIES-4105]